MSFKEKINEIEKKISKEKMETSTNDFRVDCKTYLNSFKKKISSVLYPENFDNHSQLFIPIRGDCYDEVKKYMIQSGFKSYFKNERISTIKECNCIRMFLYKNKLYFMDWSCGES
jgi:hypothetical protein